MEGGRLECLGVLEAAGEVCLHMMVTLTVAVVVTHGDLALATPATTLTQLFPQAKAQARMEPWNLGMSAGWTTWATVSSFVHFINASPYSLIYYPLSQCSCLTSASAVIYCISDGYINLLILVLLHNMHNIHT